MLGRPAEQSHMLETPTHSTLPSFWLENVAEPRVNADYSLDCSGILVFPSTGQIAHSRKRKEKQEDACFWDGRSEEWMLMKRQVSALWDKFIFLRDLPGMRNKIRLPWLTHRTICIVSSSDRIKIFPRHSLARATFARWIFRSQFVGSSYSKLLGKNTPVDFVARSCSRRNGKAWY